jgi:hypothetical protein
LYEGASPDVSQLQTWSEKVARYGKGSISDHNGGKIRVSNHNGGKTPVT